MPWSTVPGFAIFEILRMGRLSGSFLLLSRRLSTSIKPEQTENGLWKIPVKFNTSKGHEVAISAVYQDTIPQSSSKGTVISVHGAPGSHLDFKYVEPLLTANGIRHIGVNYPGFGVTETHRHLKFDNFERNGYVNALIDALNLDGKLIFMGHSRGTENALMLAAERKAHGLVMVNPHGLRLNRGLKPFWFVRACATVYNLSLPGWKTLMDPLYYKLYQYIKLKAPTGAIAGVSVTTMSNVILEKQLPYIKAINKEKTKVLFAYAGKDWLIESDVSKEAEKEFEGIEHLVEDEPEKDKQKVDAAIRRKGCSFYFPNDGHFLQKSQAEFVVNGIKAMLQS